MTRVLRAAVAAAFLAFATVAGAGAGHAFDMKGFQAAADQLEAMGKDAYRTGTPPRATDPKAAGLLNVVLDTSDLALSPPLPVSQFSDLFKRADVLGDIRSLYQFAGTGYPDFNAAAKAPDKARFDAQRAQNVITYATELGAVYDAEFVVYGAMIECFGTVLWTHPDQFMDKDSEKAIAQIRSNTVNLVAGLLEKFTVAGVSDDWLRQRIVALVAMAPYVSKFLLPEQRKLLHDATLAVAQQLKDPVVQAGLKGVADLFVG